MNFGFHGLISPHAEAHGPGGARSGACLGGPHDTDSGAAEIRLSKVSILNPGPQSLNVLVLLCCAFAADRTETFTKHAL